MNIELLRILERSSEVVTLAGHDGTLLFISDSIQSMLGLAPGELLGKALGELIHPDDRGQVLAAMSRVLRAGERGSSMVVRAVHKDGSIRWLEATTANLLDDPTVAGTVGSFRDVTERKRAADALAESEARYRRIVETANEGIWLLDADGVTTFANPRFAAMLGWTVAELIGRSSLEIVHPTDRDALPARLARFRTGYGEQLELRLVRRDGTDLCTLTESSPIRDAGGGYAGALAMLTDITDLRASEERLRQSQKMESIGRLAGGVAHDFNNLLTVIISYAGLMLGDLKADDPMRDDVEEIRAAGYRAAALTRQLLAFSRQQVLQPHVLEINGIVTGMEKLLRRLIGEDIELVTDLDAERPRVLVDRGQIEQVLMNLAVNARDAMPHGGTLTIRTRCEVGDPTTAQRSPAASVSECVSLTVSDSGEGMSECAQSRIFEPFFTTKENGRGTGLGLSTVLGIVQQSGGSVELVNTSPQGTTFRILLPRTHAETTEEIAPHALPTVRGHETVLLVEDEDSVRLLAATVLRRLGYRVLDARSGGDALDLCEQQPGQIDLLLADVVMPRMNGRELAERLEPARPSMKVLYMSGYTDDEIVRRGVATSAVDFLQKPIEPEQLARKVREVLDTARPPGAGEESRP